MSTSVFTATGAACELRYLRLGAGKPVVLLHPLRMQLEYFQPLINQLDTGRIEIIALDLPGHGLSTAPRVDYTARFFTDAMAEFLNYYSVTGATVAGESIGASITLGLAARGCPGVARVIALNSYDYGRGGGMGRSSAVAYVTFWLMLVPLLVLLVARAGTKAILRRVLEGGLHDLEMLPVELVDELAVSGSLPGHSRVFRSLAANWRTWIEAGATYPRISLPVTLPYGDGDWSRQAEREANLRVTGARELTPLPASGHFCSLDRPGEVAKLIEGVLR